MEVSVYRVVNVEQMRALEQEANAEGMTFAQMMRNAGNGAGAQIERKFTNCDRKTITGLVGAGNNGGDALVVLSFLQQHGWKTSAYLLSDRSKDDALIVQFSMLGGTQFQYAGDGDFAPLDRALDSSHFLLDGILGTGTHLPLRGAALEVLQHLKQKGNLPYTIALDCPSGVDCDSGEMDGVAISADWTICMAAVKQGLLRFPAFSMVGDLSVVDIALPPQLSAWEQGNEYCIEAACVAGKIPRRPLQANKGTFGTSLIFAGSQSFPGAAALAGKAAYLVGAGLVKIVSIPSVQQSIAGSLPEVTWHLLKPLDHGFTWDDELTLRTALQNATSILVGPGWGTDSLTADFFTWLCEELRALPQARVILDADGLNLLSKNPDLWKKIPGGSVLTPHPGEMARMTNLSIDAIQNDRQEVARTYAKKWNTVLILKGALTVIAEPSGRVALIPVATPALAKAGSGDVLAGMLAGLMAQHMDPFDAAFVAAWMHGEAGISAERRLGYSASVLASDILQAIPRVFRELKK